MSDKLPKHKKYPLVLRLYMFGEDGINTPIRNISALVRKTGVAHQTIKAWKESGWLDIDPQLIAKFVQGEITEKDLKLPRKESVSLDDLLDEGLAEKPKDDDGLIDDEEDDDYVDDFSDLDSEDVPFPPQNKKKKEKAKEPTKEEEEEEEESDDLAKQLDEKSDSFIKELIMTEEELRSNLKKDEDPKGRRIPKTVSITEFPASDMVFHDVRFYEQGPSAYQGVKHNQFLDQQITRMRAIVDMSSSQLEDMVRIGRIGSKSAEKMMLVVERGLGIVTKYQKDIIDDAGFGKVTAEERKERLKRQREGTALAVERAKKESDELVAVEGKAKSRLSSFRTQHQQRLATLDSLDDLDSDIAGDPPSDTE